MQYLFTLYAGKEMRKTLNALIITFLGKLAKIRKEYVKSVQDKIKQVNIIIGSEGIGENWNTG